MNDDWKVIIKYKLFINLFYLFLICNVMSSSNLSEHLRRIFKIPSTNNFLLLQHNKHISAAKDENEIGNCESHTHSFFSQ